MLFVWIKYIWCPSESYVGFIYFTTSLNDSCHGAVLCMYISQSFLRPRPPSFFILPFSFRFVPHSSSLIPPPSPSLSPARPQHPARGYGERCKLPSGCGHSLATRLIFLHLRPFSSLTVPTFWLCLFIPIYNIHCLKKTAPYG